MKSKNVTNTERSVHITWLCMLAATPL